MKRGMVAGSQHNRNAAVNGTTNGVGGLPPAGTGEVIEVLPREAVQEEPQDGAPVACVTSEGANSSKRRIHRGQSNSTPCSATRGRGHGAKRGRGRRVSQSVASRHRRFNEAQCETSDQQDTSGSVRLQLHEVDFCFNNIQATNEGSTVENATSANNLPCNEAIHALHGLLTPQSAFAAFAAGKSILEVLGEEAEEPVITDAVHVAYRETPEGSFLSSEAAFNSMGRERMRMEQLRLDTCALRSDLTPFPLPVLFWKSINGLKSVNQQHLRSGVCVVPPLGSATPRWAAGCWRKQDLEGKERTSTTANRNVCAGSVAEAEAVHKSDTHGGRPETDALLNVGGRVMAAAVSQEFGFAEALDHCRDRRRGESYWRSAGNSGGFVVLAVSVGPVQRTSPRIASSPCTATGANSSSGLYDRGSYGTDIGENGSGSTSARAGLEGDQSLRQQRCSAAGQLQLWSIPSHHSIKPRLRLILQHSGGNCRSLHWLPSSRLLLPRCTSKQHSEEPRGFQRVSGCCCADGSDCYRSRVGLLLGVMDNGDIAVWSIPLVPFLPEPDEMPFESVDATQKHVDAETGIKSDRSAREQLTGEEPGSTVEPPAVRDHVDGSGRCCVLLPVWRFNSPSVRFFCCAAAPQFGCEEVPQEAYCQDPVMLIGGAGEGRLYIFSFSVRPSLSPQRSSQQPGEGSLPGSPLASCGDSSERIQCSMYVMTPGCHASEVRCCSFLPTLGGTLVAIGLRACGSRSGSVIVLDLSRAAVSASRGCRGIAAVQGQSAVADTAALQVVESNCGCCRSREIHDLAWSPWSRYLVAAAENALLINLHRQQVKQLPMSSLQDAHRRKSSSSSADDDGDRCCWGCTTLGPLVFYSFSGGCLVQGNAAGLEQPGYQESRYWQWCFADTETQEALSALLHQQPHLVQVQRVAGQELKDRRRTLLALIKEQMVALTPQQTLQQTQQHVSPPVDLMQQRVNTLLALQQLEERCELLSRGLVIAEGDAIAAILNHKTQRSGPGPAKIPSILALHKVVSICPWTNPRFFAASPRIVYGGAAGILHVKTVHVSGFP